VQHHIFMQRRMRAPGNHTPVSGLRFPSRVAQCVYDKRKGWRRLAAAGIVKVKPRTRRTPVGKNANQPPVFQRCLNPVFG
jgi:hypothetical protein